jgi:hypothetical protein
MEAIWWHEDPIRRAGLPYQENSSAIIFFDSQGKNLH